MEKYLFSFDFVSRLALFIGSLLASLLWYYWRVVFPFAEFPSNRLDYRLLKWFLGGNNSKREPITKFIFQSFVDACKKHETEGLCVVWAGEPLLMVYGEESVKALINEPEAADKPKTYDIFKFALGEGLTTSNGEAWKNQKRIINPLFHGSALKGMLPNFNRNAAALVEKLSRIEETTDAAIDLLKLCSLQTFLESALNIKIGNVPDDNQMLRIIKINQHLCKFTIHRMFSPWLYWDFTLNLSPYGRKNLKAYEEGARIFRGETLRLYPAAPLFGRYLNTEVKLGKYKIPKNTTVVFFPYMLHRNSHVYSEPEKFDPERFVHQNPEIKPWTHIPFAEGIRPCIGKSYAMMEMKVILSHILRNFRVISLDSMEDVEVSWEIVLVSTKRLRLQFIPRNKS